jgi:hypothetical protein
MDKWSFSWKWIVLIVFLSYWFVLVTVQADTLEDLMNNEDIDLKTLTESLPKLAENIGKRTKSKICQEQIMGLQKYVDQNGAVDLLTSREAALDAGCSISKFCITEVVRALKKVVVGGENTLDALLAQWGKGLIPPGTDIEQLALLYYDVVCAANKKKKLEL